MYNVDISPAANDVLEEYTLRCARDNGDFLNKSIIAKK
jgi:hypothetical protein